MGMGKKVKGKTGKVKGGVDFRPCLRVSGQWQVREIGQPGTTLVQVLPTFFLSPFTFHRP
jgi:hypothetical protein